MQRSFSQTKLLFRSTMFRHVPPCSTSDRIQKYTEQLFHGQVGWRTWSTPTTWPLRPRAGRRPASNPRTSAVRQRPRRARRRAQWRCCRLRPGRGASRRCWMRWMWLGWGMGPWAWGNVGDGSWWFLVNLERFDIFGGNWRYIVSYPRAVVGFFSGGAGWKHVKTMKKMVCKALLLSFNMFQWHVQVVPKLLQGVKVSTFHFSRDQGCASSRSGRGWWVGLEMAMGNQVARSPRESPRQGAGLVTSGDCSQLGL